MKKTIVAAALSLMSISGAASANSYISAGYFDFADSDYYVSGSYMATPQLRANAKVFNVIEGHGIRVSGDYFLQPADTDGGIFVRAGISHYDFGSIRVGGQSLDLGDDTGALIALGASVFLDESDADLYVAYDTAIDGYFSVGARVAYHLGPSFAVELGYAWNSNSIDNEFKVGAVYRF